MRTSRQLWHLRPRTAASADFFVAVKDGDYDGRLFVVSKDGEVADLIGGSYFITADHEFLVSEYSSDLHAIVVFDLGENRKVLESRNIAEIDTWYRDDAGYFFTEYGKPGHADRLDFASGRLNKIRVTHANITRHAGFATTSIQPGNRTAVRNPSSWRKEFKFL
jgi:hypothetical protein